MRGADEYGQQQKRKLLGKLLGKVEQQLFTKQQDSITRRLKKGEPLLSTTQKTDLLIENMEKQTEQRTKAIEDIANTNKEKALYAHTLTQKHNYFHKK